MIENNTESAIPTQSACTAAGQEILLNSIDLLDKENIPHSNRIESNLVGTNKLSVEWFLKNYGECLSLTRSKIDGKTRPFLHCNVCKEFENVAKSTSKNGSVHIANGMRVDSQEKLQRVMTHLNGKSHNDALLAKKNHELWINQSEDHVWRKYLNVQYRELVELLLRMAMDIYNDSLHDTLPAWNWATRSLTHCRSDQFVNSINNEG